MSFLTPHTGIEDEIISLLVDLLTRKLRVEIDPSDVTRAEVIIAGPLQDDPSAVNVMIHENDPLDPADWPHFPIPQTNIDRSGSPSHLSRNYQIPLGYEMMGGAARMGYCFTLEIDIRGDEMDLATEREDVRQIAAAVSARAWQAIKAAGSTIDTSDLVQDDFGTYVVMGPFRGEFWTDQQAGEPQIARRYLRFFYQCMEP